MAIKTIWSKTIIIFVIVLIAIPTIILYLFYFIIQQIRFWKGMRRMKFKRFLEILLENIDD